MVVAAEAPDFQFVIEGVIPDVAANVTVGKSVVAYAPWVWADW